MRFGLRIPEEICQTQSRPLSDVEFGLSWRAKKGQYEATSSSLGVSQKLHLTLFPQGSIATRAYVAKLKYNYENEKQN
jgi:hypothetical protein